MKRKPPQLVLIEEIFNSITHGIGAIVSIVAFVLLLISLQEGSWLLRLGIWIFGCALILMYIFSTLYHSLTYTKAQQVFYILDRSAIFLLIAGTTTPIVLFASPNILGSIILSGLWLLAITGITLHAVFPHKFMFLYVPVYLLMGWIGTSMIPEIIRSASMQTVWLLLAGGLCYTIGTIFYAWNKLPFNHTIWHLFVIGGSICHFLTVMIMVK